MIIDCRDCGPDDWCAKHEPVTREVFCGQNHRLVMLSERHGWCAREKESREEWYLFEVVPRDGTDAYFARDAQGVRRTDIRLEWLTNASFHSYQELNDWFIANVIKVE